MPGNLPTVFDGYFIIESIHELIVDAVYSTAEGNNQSEFEIERVGATKFDTQHSQACGGNIDIDLKMPGVWNVGPNSAVVVTNNHIIWDQNGVWTSTVASSWPGPNTIATFDIPFCACNNSVATVEIFRFGADNNGTLRLDGNLIATAANLFSAQQTSTVSTFVSSPTTSVAPWPANHVQRDLSLRLTNNPAGDPNANNFGFNLGGQLQVNSAYLGTCLSQWPL